MPTVIEHGELIRRAFTYIESERQESGKTLEVLLDEAGMRFNLSPLETDALRRLCSSPNAAGTTDAAL